MLPSVKHLVHRLSGNGPLSEEEIASLNRVVGHARKLNRGQLLIEQGERSDTIWLIDSGWAFRQKNLHDGRRQITAIMLPGELTEKGPQLPFGAGDTVVAATDLTVRAIVRSEFLALLDAYHNLHKSLLFEELTRHAVTREWLLLLGKRKAQERLAYFFFETYMRLHAMGMLAGNRFELPLTQADLADLVGVSSVHLNRTLQWLRNKNLVAWQGDIIELPNPMALGRLAHFNPEMIRIAKEFEGRACGKAMKHDFSAAH